MRLAIVISFVVVFVSFAGIILLLPSYLGAIGKLNSIKNDNQYKEANIANLKSQNFTDKIKIVDSGLSALKISTNIISPREAYNKIINSIPNGVVVGRYTYNLIDDNSASISIDGTSVDRDKLIDFQNRLRLNPEFSAVDVPLESFAKKKDLSFSLKFNLIKPTKK